MTNNTDLKVGLALSVDKAVLQLRNELQAAQEDGLILGTEDLADLVEQDFDGRLTDAVAAVAVAALRYHRLRF